MIRILMFCALLIPSCLIAQTKTKTVAKPPSGTTAERGKKIYQLYCLACHQADGGGVGTLNPPLVKEWVAGDKSRLVHMLLKGSVGKVTIDGDSFSNTMPAQPNFTDQQIADILTYIRSNFGFKASAVSTAEVKKARAKIK